jgi:uncharacterized GH25 family protein
VKRALSFAFLLASLASSLAAAPIPIGGRVVGADGKTVVNARASLLPAHSNAEAARLELEGRREPEPVATAKSDAAGVFHLAAPEAGMWRVRVEAPGTVPVEALLLPLTQESDLPDATLVPDAGLRVQVTDPAGRPLPGAWVHLENAKITGGDLWHPALRRFAVTDANGSATLPRSRDEVVAVWAAAPGTVPVEQKNVRGAASVRLMAGRPRRIEVRDPQGKAVAGVFVRWSQSEWLAGRTSEAGVLDLIVPGGEAGVDLRLMAADGRALSYHLKPAKPDESGPAKIVLPAAVAGTGKILSAKDGLGLAGALVWPMNDMGAVVRSAADGTFRLPSLAPEGVAVSAVAAGFFPAEGKAGGDRRPVLALQPRLGASGIVVDEAGRPVAGADVRASVPAGSHSARSRSGANGFARSVESGRFRLTSLAAGTSYELKVERQGFAPARMELPDPAEGHAWPELRIVLHPGRTVSGLVVDAQQRPVAGAQAVLQPASPTNLLQRVLTARNVERIEPPAVTDAAGRFVIKNIPGGTFDLKVRARGFGPLTVPGLTVPAGNGGTDLGTVVLAPGTALRGLVVDAQGQPIAGVEIRIKAPDRDAFPLPAMPDRGPVEAVSGADGTFLLEDLAPGGNLDLTATCPGYGPGSAPGVAVPSVEPVRLVLQSNVRVSGRALDPDGKPVSGASVVVAEETAMSFGGQSSLFPAGRSHRGTTADDGTFSLDDVSPGPIELFADAPHHQQANLKGLEVKPGRDLAGVEVVLPAGGVVTGKVVSADGRPIPEATVAVNQPSPGGVPSFTAQRTTTDAGGEYRIEALSPGPHTLEARAEGYRYLVHDVEVTPETSTVDFQLERGLEVAGRVVDDAGNPVDGTLVSLRAGLGARSSASAISGGDGAFRLTGIESGTYELTASKMGYVSAPAETELTVAGAPVEGLEVKLSAGGTITGHLAGLEFSQLARVRVWASSTLELGQVDPEGNYQILHVAPGPVTVNARVSDTSLQAEGHVTLEPGALQARLDLQFGGGRSLTGVVLRNGEPLAGASLLLIGNQTARMQAAATDHQGEFRFAGLDDGTYNLVVSSPAGASHQESVEISADREIRIELHTASLAGRVTDATDGTPIPGARISLLSASDPPSWLNNSAEVSTDARGSFNLAEVGDGSWRVRATQDGYAPAERSVLLDGSSPPDAVEIRMDPTVGVTVVALLASGQPPERLQVAVLDASGGMVASGTYPTGENGRTRIANVPQGSWQLLVESDASGPVFTPAASPGPTLQILLPPAGDVQVQVPALASGGGTAKVTLIGAGGPFRNLGWDGSVTAEWTTSSGTATISHVPPGAWQAVARTADGRSWTGTATVAPGAVAEVVLK